MDRITAAIAIFILGFTSFIHAAPTVAKAAFVGEKTTPSVTVEIDDPEWARLAEWTIGRFVAVGIDLPAGVVTVHDSAEPCQGASGLYVPGDLPQVRICAQVDPGSRVARLTFLHEIGHLWAEALPADRKAELLSLRGLEAWQTSELPPHEWGAEHAAEILSWGLMDEEITIIRITDTSVESLGTGFQLLTGVEPLTPAAAAEGA